MFFFFCIFEIFTANFSLPSSECWFEEVKYVELEAEEAKKKVDEYNEQGKKALPPPSSHSNRNNRDYDNRRRHGGGGGKFNLVSS